MSRIVHPAPMQMCVDMTHCGHTRKHKHTKKHERRCSFRTGGLGTMCLGLRLSAMFANNRRRWPYILHVALHLIALSIGVVRLCAPMPLRPVLDCGSGIVGVYMCAFVDVVEVRGQGVIVRLLIAFGPPLDHTHKCSSCVLGATPLGPGRAKAQPATPQ